MCVHTRLAWPRPRGSAQGARATGASPRRPSSSPLAVTLTGALTRAVGLSEDNACREAVVAPWGRPRTLPPTYPTQQRLSHREISFRRAVRAKSAAPCPRPRAEEDLVDRSGTPCAVTVPPRPQREAPPPALCPGPRSPVVSPPLCSPLGDPQLSPCSVISVLCLSRWTLSVSPMADFAAVLCVWACAHFPVEGQQSGLLVMAA